MLQDILDKLGLDMWSLFQINYLNLEYLTSFPFFQMIDDLNSVLMRRLLFVLICSDSAAWNVSHLQFLLPQLLSTKTSLGCTVSRMRWELYIEYTHVLRLFGNCTCFLPAPKRLLIAFFLSGRGPARGRVGTKKVTFPELASRKS